MDNNYVETVISLAPNLFYGTTIAVNILVLAKNKKDTTTQFIDASGLFKKETNNNVLLDSHIEQIMAVFDSKANVDHFAKSVPLARVRHQNADFAFLVKPLPCESTTYAHFCGSFVVATA